MLALLGAMLGLIVTATPASAQSVLRNFVFTLDFTDRVPIQGTIFEEMGLPAPENGTLIVKGLADTTEPDFNRYDVTVNGIAIDNNLSRFAVGPESVFIRVREEDSSRVTARFTFDTPDGLFRGFTPSTVGDSYPQAILALGTYQLAPNATLMISAVPEPAMWAFMILGFGGTGLSMRRRTACLARA